MDKAVTLPDSTPPYFVECHELLLSIWPLSGRGNRRLAQKARAGQLVQIMILAMRAELDEQSGDLE